MHNYKELKVWQESMKLAKMIYIISSDFPQEERFGLTSQLRRCAISVPSNVAEGAGRKSDKEFLHFLSISTGSIYELETQLLLALDLGYTLQTKTDNTLEVISGLQKMLYRFQEQLSAKIKKS